ncbi:helix-turn-helix transcriptional regulator [Heyndrickxia acidicola]|uniref:Helix-turn-helix transcriptional regulator n=1 Tax=Heyndrickxia acidicola TaxID=209389 RepID=A0ABU6MDP4_9BACI|nr:helix-turn-helix transcriptional regulator [Heyndrickxia acidicola]MED1202554.1 helix-turn-helix transcriptional regulator [Heyndrickxia acidicola]
MFGLFGGKPRTPVGKFLDKWGITQEWLAKKTKISRNTISKIASDNGYSPNLSTIKKVMNALREVDPKAKTEDFFDI